MSTTLRIDRRFRGPDGSGNGGWTAGALAAFLDAGDRPVEVTLRRPPPLDRDLPVERDGDAVRLLDDAEDDRPLVVSAHRVDTDLPTVAAAGAATAAAAEAGFRGHHDHPFPGCFACGPDRAEGDGLRIFPGPLPTGGVGATWTPGEDVDLATAWAALDCVGGWAGDIASDHPMVLGRITVAVSALPAAGTPYVVTGALLGTEGRKTSTAATLHGPDGAVLGRAAHTWIAVPSW